MATVPEGRRGDVPDRSPRRGHHLEAGPPGRSGRRIGSLLRLDRLHTRQHRVPDLPDEPGHEAARRARPVHRNRQGQDRHSPRRSRPSSRTSRRTRGWRDLFTLLDDGKRFVWDLRTGRMGPPLSLQPRRHPGPSPHVRLVPGAQGRRDRPTRRVAVFHCPRRNPAVRHPRLSSESRRQRDETAD